MSLAMWWGFFDGYRYIYAVEVRCGTDYIPGFFNLEQTWKNAIL